MNSRLLVLCYHRVLDPTDPSSRPYFERGTAISSAVFSAHMDLLASHFQVLDEQRAVACICGDASPEAPAAWITVDDGYADVRSTMAPLLAERGLPATAFVSTSVLVDRTALLPADAWYQALACACAHSGTLRGFGHPAWHFDLTRPADYARMVDGPERRTFLRAHPAAQATLLATLRSTLDLPPNDAPSPSPYLEADDLHWLPRNGWSIGSHTQSHRLLPSLPPEELEQELVGAADDLVGLGLPRPKSLAYPDGAFSARVSEAVRDAGYELGLGLHGAPPAQAAGPYGVARLLAPNLRYLGALAP